MLQTISAPRPEKKLSPQGKMSPIGFHRIQLQLNPMESDRGHFAAAESYGSRQGTFCLVTV